MVQCLLQRGVNGEGSRLTRERPQPILLGLTVHLRLPDDQTCRTVGEKEGLVQQGARDVPHTHQLCLAQRDEGVEGVGHTARQPGRVRHLQQLGAPARPGEVVHLGSRGQSSRLQRRHQRLFHVRPAVGAAATEEDVHRSGRSHVSCSLLGETD